MAAAYRALGLKRSSYYPQRPIEPGEPAHRQALLVGRPGLTGFLFHGLELAHEQDDCGGFATLGIELESVAKFSSHMGQASRTHYPGSADLFVALVAVALKDNPVMAEEELSGTFPRSAHAKVENNRSARPTVLQLLALVVAALGLLALHAAGGLVGPDVSTFE